MGKHERHTRLQLSIRAEEFEAELGNKKLPDSYLGHNIRSKAIMDIKELLDKNNIEMPSQVIEHKMYRGNKLLIQKE